MQTSDDEGDRERRPNRVTARGRAIVDRGRRTAEQTFDQHRHRPLVDLGLRIYERDRDMAGSVVGSAVAFRLFLFFVPLLLFAAGVVGFLGGRIEADEVSSGAGIGGGLGTQIREALTQPNSTRWAALVLGVAGMATTGRSLSKTMVAASCLAWRIPVRARAPVKLTGAIVGLVAGVGLVAVLVNRIRAELGVAVTGVSFAVALGIYAVAWVLVLAVVPRPTSDPGALLPGGALLALTLVGMQAVSQLYLPSRFSRASELYGAIGTSVVTLGWFFILGRAIVLAMALNAAVYERFGSITGVVFSLPGFRALPRRSAWVRRTFDRDLAVPGKGPQDDAAPTAPADPPS